MARADISKQDVVNMHDAKTQFSKLVARVEAGEQITIARAGKPIAKLVPVRRAAWSEVFGCMSHLGPIPDDAVIGPDPEIEELFGMR
jgi:prevent-host-death family protein